MADRGGGRGRGGDRGGRGGGDRGGRGGGDRGGRGGGGRGGGGGGPVPAEPLKIETVDINAVDSVKAGAGSLLPHLFGGLRSQRLQLASPSTKDKKSRTVEDAEKERDQLSKARDAVDAAVAKVQTIPSGKGGNQAKQTTNFVPLTMDVQGNVYQYDVKVEPELKNPRARDALVSSVLAEKLKGSNVPTPIQRRNVLYSQGVLHPQGTKGVDLPYTPKQGATGGWRSKPFTAKLTFTKTVPLDVKNGISTEAYQVITSILTEAIQKTGITKIAGTYMDLDGIFGPPVEVPGARNYPRLKLANGLRFVLHPTQRGLLMNVDITSRVVRSGTVLDEITRLKGAGGDKVIAEELEGVMCASTYLTESKKQTFKVTKVRFDLNPGSNIPVPSYMKDVAPQTFANYMATHHNLTVKDQKQPLLEVVLPRELDREGNPTVRYYLPEFATIAGQSKSMRSDGDLQQSMKRLCLIPPETRFNRIYNAVEHMAKNPEFTKFAQSYGLSVTPKLITVPARVLPFVDILDANKKTISQNDRHSWLLKAGVKVSNPPPPVKWVVVHPAGTNNLENFVSTLLTSTLNGLGGRWPQPVYVSYQGMRIKNALESIDEDANFVLFVLPKNTESDYAQVKEETLREWKIPSQCVLVKNVTNERNTLNVSSRVGGQMLVKWGGSLWGINGGDVSNALVCGVDFAKSSDGNSQVLALAALDSNDFGHVGCFTEVFSGKAGSAMMKVVDSAVKAYKNKAKKPPQSIVVYRSGMDEGDVPRILDEEVIMMQGACEKNKVQLCFLASLKRSHARFLAPPCGTVVDKDILPATGFTFLMVPQVVNIGTATAMRFSVLSSNINEINNDGSRIESLTFKLCHSFFGWWSTTREPSVIMYATRAANLVSLFKKPREGIQVPREGFQAF